MFNDKTHGTGAASASLCRAHRDDTIPVPPKQSLFHRIAFPVTSYIHFHRFWRNTPAESPSIGVDGEMMALFNKTGALYILGMAIPAIVVAVVNATSGGEYPDPLYSLSTSRIGPGRYDPHAVAATTLAKHRSLV